jgi:peptidylprolyl isomerase
MTRWLAVLALMLFTVAPAAAQPASDPSNTVYLQTKDGRVTIRLGRTWRRSTWSR